MRYLNTRASSRARTTLVRRTVGVGVAAAAGLGVGIASAGSASAVNWDAIAQCESGGNWSINTGNGFRGGLQFTDSTWRAYGGTGAANNASREQQIAVAERVLAGQGIGAWPTCGKLGGSGSTAASRSAARPAPAPKPAATKATTTKAVTTTKQAAPKAKTGQGAGAATTTKVSAPAKKAVASTKKATPAKKATTPNRYSGKTYTVKAGDSLSKIAAQLGVGDWQKLYKANADAIKDPNLIYVGQVLKLPA